MQDTARPVLAGFDVRCLAIPSPLSDARMMSTVSFGQSVPRNAVLTAWVEEVRQLCTPESVFWCDGSIEELLRRTDFHSVMIFTRTKMDADRLYSAIESDAEGHKVAVMHGDISQKDRERALADFRAGTVEVIVATDVAARGLDISGVTHVINFMVPEHSEDYVHRIGRTGRAQKEGDAFTLFSAEEIGYVQSIERLINQKIERRKLDNFNYTFTTVLDDEKRALDIMRGRKKKKGRR